MQGCVIDESGAAKNGDTLGFMMDRAEELRFEADAELSSDIDDYGIRASSTPARSTKPTQI